MRLLIPLTLAATVMADDIFVESDQLIDVEQSLSVVLDLGDLDADGDLDAVIGTYVSPALLYLNEGDGTFALSEQALPPVLAGSVIMEDFDGDDDLDVFMLSHSFPSHILFNDGQGNLVQGEQNLGSMVVRGADAGDIDGDGDLDIFVSHVHPHRMTPLFNDGAATFTFGEEMSNFVARAVRLGDLDGDGDLDIFAGYANFPAEVHHNRVYINDGAGTFVDSGQLLGNRYSTDLRLADVDDDGDLDAIVANAALVGSDGANTVWLNNGDATFKDSGQRLGAADTNGIDVADIDGDGDVDFLAANANAAEAVWLNDGSGAFSLAQLIGDADPQTVSVALGDLDGDDDADAFTLNFDSSGDGVLFNVGGCSADVNKDGVLNLLDFVAFQNAWTGADPCADCNADGAFSILDFICYQNAFAAGCP